MERLRGDNPCDEPSLPFTGPKSTLRCRTDISFVVEQTVASINLVKDGASRICADCGLNQVCSEGASEFAQTVVGSDSALGLALALHWTQRGWS